MRKPVLVLALAICMLAACGDTSQKAPQHPTTPQSSQNTTPAKTPANNTPQTPSQPPSLTGFFTRSNFATIAVPTPDGKEETLSIKSLDVSVTIEGRLARTEVRQVFHNHTKRRTEGKYAFTLPDRASISRLSMDVNGSMMEGELVEREKARQTYESIVRRQKDPALLEWQSGNRFKTQIFPIEANADKTVVLTYEQILPSQNHQSTYTYNLPNLEEDPRGSLFQSFSFSLKGQDTGALEVLNYKMSSRNKGNHGEVGFEATKFTPQGPIKIVMSGQKNREEFTTRFARQNHETFFLADFSPNLPLTQEDKKRNLILVLDTSAGIGSPVLKQSTQLAEELLNTLQENTTFQIVHGDFKIHQCSPTPMTGAHIGEARKCLKSLSAGGATDLDGLLQRAAIEAHKMQGPTSIVLLSDGAASIGELDADLISTRLKNALKEDRFSLHTVAIGHGPDEDFLRELARKTRGHNVRMFPHQAPQGTFEELTHLIQVPLLTDVSIKTVRGTIEGLVPHQPINIAPGERLPIMGRIDQGPAQIEVTGTWQGKPFKRLVDLSPPQEEGSAMLRNFWARGVIEEMQDKSISRDKIVQTSLHYGVMSRYTSFLVLENDEAYKRFKIERRKEKERIAALEKAKRDKALADQKKEADKAQNKDLNTLVADKTTLHQLNADNDEVNAPVQQTNLTKGTGNLQEFLAGNTEVAVQRNQIAFEQTERAELEEEKEETEAAAEPLAEAPPGAPRPKRAAGLALRGTGRGGGGESFGRIGGLRNERTPKKRARGKSSRRARKPIPSSTHPHYKGKATKISKGVNARAVQEAVQRLQNQTTHCYTSAVQRDPYTAGTLYIPVQVQTNGRIPRNTIKGTSGNAMESCIQSSLRYTYFPGHNKPYTFLYEISFGDTEKLYKDKIKPLEDTAQRTEEQNRELLKLYVRARNNKRATKLLNSLINASPEPQRATRTLAILNTNELQRTYRDLYIAALEKQLDNPDANKENTLISLWQALLDDDKALRNSIERFGAHKLPTTFASNMLAALFARDAEKEAKSLLTLWEKNNLYSAAELYQLVSNDPSLKKPLAAHIARAANAVFTTGDRRAEVAQELVDAVMITGEHGIAAAHIVPFCQETSSDPTRCQTWLDALSQDERAQEALQKINERILAKIRTQRASDFGNPQLILQMVETLNRLKRTQEADRTLSELVETSPHNYEARRKYASVLVDHDKPQEACAQYASAVQLNPAERNTFRTMMRMRRSFEDKAEMIKQCIVNGVSNLPVQRAASLVLTWEDPSADIDLHIHEVGGEEVYYQHRESQNQGLLYYDITDGFGPEIYVLGSGPRGEYKLTLVYYSGTAPTIRGTLTVLRNAGSPQEIREERPFVLQKKNGKAQIPVGTFTL